VVVRVILTALVSAWTAARPFLRPSTVETRGTRHHDALWQVNHRINLSCDSEATQFANAMGFRMVLREGRWKGLAIWAEGRLDLWGVVYFCVKENWITDASHDASDEVLQPATDFEEQRTRCWRGSKEILRTNNGVLEGRSTDGKRLRGGRENDGITSR
jgi:hypothetical protein